MTVSAAKLHRSRGFWLVLGLFLAANILSAVSALTLADPPERTGVGFPFPAFIVGSPVSDATGNRVWQFYWSGLLLDVVVALTIAVLVVWLGSFVRGSDAAD